MTSLTATENLNNNPTGSKPESGGVLANTITVVASKGLITTPKLLPNGHEPSSISDIILTQQFIGDNSNKTNVNNSHHHISRDIINNKVPNDVRALPVAVTAAAAPTDYLLQKVNNTSGVNEDNSQSLDVRKLGDRRASSPFQNGRTELLIGAEDNKFKTTAIVESNNNKLGVEPEIR